MPRNGRPFQDLLLEQLANPEVAKHYLNEALDESPESFLTALKTVAQARQMARVARDAGVQRETLYRSLSSQGNPTLDTLSSILKAVGLKILITEEDSPPPTGAVQAKGAADPVQYWPSLPFTNSLTTFTNSLTTFTNSLTSLPMTKTAVSASGTTHGASSTVDSPQNAETEEIPVCLPVGDAYQQLVYEGVSA